MTTIADLVVAQLRSRDMTAVRVGQTSLSSAGLDAWSGAVASHLQGRGTGRGHFVPVLAARGGALVAGCLGVLRSGAAFAPLSLDTPKHRLRHILSELDARVVLTDEAGRSMLDELAVDLTLLEDLRGVDGLPAAVGTEPDDPAVVIYTSGTTGRPKGVLVPHRGLLNTALWWAADNALTVSDRVLCTWSTAFDGATFEAFRTLVSGATLVYADDLERRDPRALTRLVRGPLGATVTSMTPSLARAMLDSDEGGPTTLRTLYLGGEAVTRQLAKDCSEAWGVEVRNIYGPTEASCIGTFAPVDLAEERPPIGGPLPNTRAYVLGPHGEELPREVPGELYLAGTGIALGYLGQPELTAAAFRPDPYCDEPGARMYATGDRAVLRQDGAILCLGRVDDQVKILGHRVEPNEVARLIEEQPGIRGAVVLAEGEPRRLVAFVELDDVDAPSSREDVLRPLQRWLPPAVLPTEVYAVPAIPMTVNDKADLTALRGMRDVRLAHAAGPSVQLHGDELRAARIFATALAGTGQNRRPVDALALAPDTDFFVLGGHSLLAVNMLAAAERQVGHPLPLGQFLAEPTVAGLGRLLAGGRSVTAEAPTSDEVYPASSAQRRFWLIDRVEQLRSAYLAPTVLEFDSAGFGDRDVELLAEATRQVLARHPALRSRFRLDTTARAVVYTTDGPPPPLQITSARGWDEQRLAAHLATACWSPFDLAEQAPARAEILVGEEGVLLILAIHHIVIDGWGQAELLDQIAAVYRARRDGATADLPPAIHPAAVLTGSPVPAAESVLAHLRGAPTDIELRHDRPRPTVQSTTAATRTRTLDEGLAARLRETMNDLGVTTFMTTAALLGAVLARSGGQRDFLFAFPWLGRETGETAHAVGMFVNTLVLRVDLRGEPSWRELLGRVRDSAMTAYRAAAVPFDAVAAAIHPGRDLSRPPVTPVYLAALDAPPAIPDFGPDATVRFRQLVPLHLKYELELVATDLPDSVSYTATYATGLFDAATIDALLDSIERCVTDLTTDLNAGVTKESSW
ncbi:amino acid adenylation domain-containing protein [Micromonospora sp. NPDC048871]|uniref:non-ribosomal peptide synthetase n=1 Tax=unclassified Micromonospora TaxID=2617518 RepID=UPI002E102B8C|nr:amino acid adenylation domain-containing protein [Micromonospora sp. NBC_01739]